MFIKQFEKNLIGIEISRPFSPQLYLDYSMKQIELFMHPHPDTHQQNQHMKIKPPISTSKLEVVPE